MTPAENLLVRITEDVAGENGPLPHGVCIRLEFSPVGLHVSQFGDDTSNLVAFDAYNNIGWYDIEPSFLKVVDKPLEENGLTVSQ
jgi:hypothetical protein